MDQDFAVYWRTGNRQLFSFRQNIKAASPQEARNLIRGALRRQNPVMVGVKQLAEGGRRCAQRGQWVG
jgi:hypothetical protein